MTDSNLHEVERLFLDCLDIDEASRLPFLAVEAAGNQVLVDQVVGLLNAHGQTGVVDRLAKEISAPLASAFSSAPGLGRMVGPYKIQSLLGRGGMGNVYLANRSDGQFEQQVALKLIRDGINSEAIRARFVMERQLLAKLNHPHIARLLDGGIDEQGRPYFAMEVVEGARLDRYADEKKFGINARLGLFEQVCDAVQYAHQNLVVHRDLKPANILVRENDGKPHVTLMDFGIARLLDVEGSTEATATVTRAMTPEYASPEQVRGETVTTRTDVYSLGVILYELLTGHRPYEVRGLTAADLERVICDTQPPPPSVIVGMVATGERGRDTITPQTVSVNRGTAPDTLSRYLEGDLDTIVMKALAKEPERRYSSADAFLDDIKRHLAGMPVVARPDTIRYRISKFAQRHRYGMVAGILVLLSLVGGMLGTVWQAQKATTERDRAIVEAKKSEESLSLLVGLFEQADPGQTAGETVTAREVLDRAALRVRKLEAGSATKPILLDAIARVFHNLGLYSRADDLFREALAADSLSNADGSAIQQTLIHYGSLQYTMGNLEKSDSLLTRAIALIRADPDARSVDLSFALHEHAVALRSLRKTDEAELAAMEALELKRSEPVTRPTEIAATLYVVAAVQHDRGDYKKGEELFREAIDLFRSDSTVLEPVAADASESLGQFLQFQGNFEEAEEFMTEALSIRQRLYGADHPSVISSLANLGSLYYSVGRTAEAKASLERVVQFGDENPGAVDMVVWGAKHALGLILFSEERFDEASELLESVVSAYKGRYGEEYPMVIPVMNHLARSRLRGGDRITAMETFGESEGLAQKSFGEDHPYVGIAIHGKGSVARADGDLDVAEEYYRQSIAVFEKSLKPDNDLLVAVSEDLGSLMVETGRSGEAVSILRAALAAYNSKLPDDHASVLNAKSFLAIALAESGELEEALSLASASHEGLVERYGVEHRHSVGAERRLERVRELGGRR